jgi:hypothetical protein
MWGSLTSENFLLGYKRIIPTGVGTKHLDSKEDYGQHESLWAKLGIYNSF